jgi:hypothetical protein
MGIRIRHGGGLKLLLKKKKNEEIYNMVEEFSRVPEASPRA